MSAEQRASTQLYLLTTSSPLKTSSILSQGYGLAPELEAALRDAAVACELVTSDPPPASAAVVAVFRQLVHVWQIADLRDALPASDEARHGGAEATARAQQVGKQPCTCCRTALYRVLKRFAHHRMTDRRDHTRETQT